MIIKQLIRLERSNSAFSPCMSLEPNSDNTEELRVAVADGDIKKSTARFLSWMKMSEKGLEGPTQGNL